MEVHKHPHHVMHSKKWSEYLLEFLMLFLAVFLGFIAENFREHEIEKERGRQYILSFYDDLQRDTASFARLIKQNEIKLEPFDNIFKCYDTIKKNWGATSCLIRMVKYSRTNISATFSNGTVEQLKNAGGYRLLSNEDRDSIIGYDNSIQSYINYQSTFFQQSQDVLRSTFSMIEGFPANKFLFPGDAGADSSRIEIPLLISDDKVMLNKFFNDLLRYKVAISGQNRQINVRRKKAESLLIYFKNKYHLE